MLMLDSLVLFQKCFVKDYNYLIEEIIFYFYSDERCDYKPKTLNEVECFN